LLNALLLICSGYLFLLLLRGGLASQPLGLLADPTIDVGLISPKLTPYNNDIAAGALIMRQTLMCVLALAG